MKRMVAAQEAAPEIAIVQVAQMVQEGGQGLAVEVVGHGDRLAERDLGRMAMM